MFPKPLERIVMKALEKDPDKRFQTAREPARDLQAARRAGPSRSICRRWRCRGRPAVDAASLPRRQHAARIFTPVAPWALRLHCCSRLPRRHLRLDDTAGRTHTVLRLFPWRITQGIPNSISIVSR